MDPISGFFEPLRQQPTPGTLECIYRSGGWCEIWRGVSMGQYRAYKCLKAQFRDKFLYQELLRKEFEISRELSHPCIRQCFALTEIEGLGYCIEMEYVEGDTLADLLDRKALTPETARIITAELLDTVAQLHRKGITHNDLKPSNILVAKNGHIKLIDFGLADTDSWAILKLKGGTPTYAAPELQNGREGRGGQASDIYSLGVILGKLGTVPRRIVHRCCNSKPKARWQSVEQIQDALAARKHFPWPVTAAAAAILALLLWFHTPVINFISSLFPVKNAPWGGLCVEAIEDGELSFRSVAPHPFEYSYDTRHWIREDTLLTLKIRRRQCVYFRANNETYTIRKMEKSRYSHFSFSGQCYVYGNMMSLIDSTGFDKADAFTSRSHNFAKLFEFNPGLRFHPDKKLLLPATGLRVGCYRWMFQGCTGLTEAPALPATELKGYCYQAMFKDCTNLETAPELPATTLSPFCYAEMFMNSGVREAPGIPAMFVPERACRSMFEGCSKLTRAGSLPATELDAASYMFMFSRSGLEKAPALPATNLAPKCYSYMFSYCSRLEQAPVLPAAVLTEGCYQGMFQNATSLRSVEVHAIDLSAQDCTTNWMLDVPPGGTFLCHSAAWPSERGSNGIPRGWELREL